MEIRLDGKWKSMGRIIASACKDAQDRGAIQVKYEARGQPCLIDLSEMRQVNLRTGKSRPIRQLLRTRQVSPSVPSPCDSSVRPPTPEATPVAPSVPPPAPDATPAARPGSRSAPTYYDPLGPAPAPIHLRSEKLFGPRAMAMGHGPRGPWPHHLAYEYGVMDLGDITDAAMAAGDVIWKAIADEFDPADAIAAAAALVPDLV